MGSTYVQEAASSEASIIVGYPEGVTVLELLGEHDLASAEKLSFHILENAFRGRGVVVSLSETTFLDSSILHTLFQGDQEMLRRGRRLVLHGRGSDAIQRVFELARVSDQLVYCDSFEEAITFASQRYPSAVEFKELR